MSDKIDPVEAVQDILSELKARAMDAEKANDAYVFGIYNRLVKVVSPIATQAFARQQREARAETNKTDKRMRKEERDRKEEEKKGGRKEEGSNEG
jgi:hypothetical protein